MTGEQYFKAEADQITASCKADGGYFSSFIFLFSMDVNHAMNVAAKKAQKGFLQTFMVCQGLFMGATYMHSADMPDEGVYFNYITNALTAAACWYGADAL